MLCSSYAHDNRCGISFHLYCRCHETLVAGYQLSMAKLQFTHCPILLNPDTLNDLLLPPPAAIYDLVLTNASNKHTNVSNKTENSQNTAKSRSSWRTLLTYNPPFPLPVVFSASRDALHSTHYEILINWCVKRAIVLDLKFSDKNCRGMKRLHLNWAP